jgi:hypothetical protein
MIKEAFKLLVFMAVIISTTIFVITVVDLLVRLFGGGD